MSDKIRPSGLGPVGRVGARPVEFIEGASKSHAGQLGPRTEMAFALLPIFLGLALGVLLALLRLTK